MHKTHPNLDRYLAHNQIITQEEQECHQIFSGSVFYHTNRFPIKCTAKQSYAVKKLHSRMEQLRKNQQSKNEIDINDLKNKVKESKSKYQGRTFKKSRSCNSNERKRQKSCERIPDLSIIKETLHINNESKKPNNFGIRYMTNKSMVVVRKKLNDPFKQSLPTCVSMNLQKKNEEESRFCLTEVAGIEKIGSNDDLHKNFKKESKKIKLKKLKSRQRKQQKLRQQNEKQDEKLKGWQVKYASFEYDDSIMH